MGELQRDRELLREEVNQLKSQVGWIMETLQVLLRITDYFPPISTAEVNVPLTLSDLTPVQGHDQSVAIQVLMCGPSPKDLPQPSFLKLSDRHCLSVLPQSHKNRNQRLNKKQKNSRRGVFDPIPMTYTELYPYLVYRGLITTRAIYPPDPLPARFRTDLHYEFQQKVAGHDLEG